MTGAVPMLHVMGAGQRGGAKSAAPPARGPVAVDFERSLRTADRGTPARARDADSRPQTGASRELRDPRRAEGGQRNRDDRAAGRTEQRGGENRAEHDPSQPQRSQKGASTKDRAEAGAAKPDQPKPDSPKPDQPGTQDQKADDQTVNDAKADDATAELAAGGSLGESALADMIHALAAHDDDARGGAEVLKLGAAAGQVMQQIARALGHVTPMATGDAAAAAMVAGGDDAVPATSGESESHTGGRQGGSGQSTATLASLLSQLASGGQSSGPAFTLNAAAAGLATGAANTAAMLDAALNQGDAQANASRLAGAVAAQGPSSSAPSNVPGAPNVPSAPTTPSTSAELNGARLARGLQSAVQQGGGSVTLRLTPPDMGTVRIEMQVRGGAVNAQFHAQTEAARQLLTQQLGQLRQALESQGLSVDRLGAQTMSPSSSSTGSQQGAHEDGGDVADDGRSRGEYAGDGGENAHGDEEAGNENEGAESAFEKALNEVG